MNDPEPFSAFDSDRTVIVKPSAGRTARQTGSASATTSTSTTATSDLTTEAVRLPEVPGSAGFGPLLQLTSPLLIAGARIRVLAQHADPAGLRAALVAAVRKFEADAHARGLPNEQVVAGRYLMCTYIDECASGTPWGGSGAWSTHSLLVLFHNESWGGEKLFQLLGKLAENVGTNRSLLELIYVVLAMGFEGRYRVLNDGRAQLEGVREKLAQMLRNQGAGAATELSPHWVGSGVAGTRLRDGIPIWLVATAAALLLALVFVALRLSISSGTGDTFTALQALDVKVPVASVPPPPPPPAPVPRLSGLLKPEIDAGKVQVRDLADRSIITIPGDGFFKSGGVDVSPEVMPLLVRIGEELKRIPGQILVTGHTDNQPIRSLRFPSNWHLSKERAQAVNTILTAEVKAERVRSEGLADTQPIADNSTAAGRALNRRVEITLRPTPAR